MIIDNIRIRNKNGLFWFGVGALVPFISFVVLILLITRDPKLRHTPSWGRFWGVILITYGILMLITSIALLFEKDAFWPGVFFLHVMHSRLSSAGR